ncbi:MAG: hypothetical protein HQ567_30965 [Candidatus Nealsonbacteria bacterium]|nr:hypothetical protein [Candidatus Nealsonbacteria bacterium]
MGKKKPGTITTAISVPRDLKRRMSKVREDVNWSALACKAFEDKLTEIKLKERTRGMESAIERLRASKGVADSEDYEHGFSVGRKWAEKWSTAPPLEKLERLRDTSDWDSFFSQQGSSAYGIDEQLYFCMYPEFDGSRQEARDFWDSAIGDDEYDVVARKRPEVIKGWAEGALDFWNTVKDLL